MTGRLAASRLAAGGDLLLASTAALTVTTAVIAWRGFTDNPDRFLVPLVVIGLAIAVTGSAARTLGVAGVLVVALQAVVATVGALRTMTGSWLPGPATFAEARQVLDLAVDSAQRYAAPVAGDVPPVEPLLLVAGLACLLVVDVLACSLRRVSLAGLPLLTVYTLPVSMLGGSVAWWVFALPAVGFTAMLYQSTAAELDRWDAADTGSNTGADGGPHTGRRGGGAFGAALGIGATATGLALVLPLAVPTAGLDLIGGSGRGDGDQEISLENPMTDMRRDLRRPADTPLVRVATAEPDPSYLRISVLNRFSDDAWTSGDRDLPDDQLAQGPQPPPVGVDETVPRSTRDWDVEVLDQFESTWLPTPFPLASIQAEGRWKYDESTRDFIAAEEDLTTSGLRYSLTSLQLELSTEELATSSPSSAAVGAQFTDLPADLPDEVGDLAREVTQGADSEFGRAVALQNWFRRDGGFTYDLQTDGGNGPATLARFLDADDPDGRVGYCEQFASAMAAMARELDMPSRVAVGFLRPDRVAGATTPLWEYSSDDLHAWPEIYFPGAGWVRFEPTPATRASRVPDYTRNTGPTEQQPAPEPDPGAQDTPEPNAGTGSGADRGGAQALRIETSAPVSAGLDRRGLVAALLAIAILVALLVGPMVVRRSRTTRRRRGASAVEGAWAELADTMVDLGYPWSTGRSPARARADVLPAISGAPGDLAGRAVDALDRLVASLEVSRYSRPGSRDETGAWGDHATLQQALAAASSPGRRVLARLLPRSLVWRPGAPGVAGRPLEDAGAGSRVGAVVDRLD